jgi:RNA polymerase sigma factor (sigma-70 family)
MTAASAATGSLPRSGEDPMESVGTQILLGVDGNPLSPRIQGVLRDLLPRFRNRFLTLDDEVLVIEMLEEAGRRVTAGEAVAGPAENLEAYAWTTLVNVARTRLRHSSMKLARATLGSEASEAVLETIRSPNGTPEQIESGILVRELIGKLSAEERQLIARKQFGYSSREIAREQGTSPARVDMLFHRLKRKCREVE